MDIETIAPLVSIVLPTHNGSRYIEEAIQSCLNQTYRDVEVIVVDDGSTDDTANKVEHYQTVDQRLKLIRQDRNRRLPAALNAGFARAAGAYLTWTSDDNYYRSDAIREMVAFLEHRPNVDMVYTDYSCVDEAGNLTQRMRVQESDKLFSQAFNCLSPCFLYRRRVRDVVGEYAEDLYLAEDYDYWLRVSILCRPRPYHQDLYCYRIHQGSLSFQYRDKVEPMLEQVLAGHLPRAPLTASTKAAVAFMLAQRARARREIIPMLNHLSYACSCSPRVFAQCLWRATHKRLIRAGIVR